MSEFEKTPEEKAAELGLVVVYPKENELLLDIDSDADARWLMDMIQILRENNVTCLTTRTTTSKSGNLHVYIDMGRPVSPIERVALQACMGSDRKRELLSMLEIWNKKRAPTLLFEKPNK